MGTWNVSLSSNDIYADIYYEFFELYNDGHSVEDITNKIISENQEIISSFEDGHEVWFALAKAQWECKGLDMNVMDKVSEIIMSGANVKVWKELGATESDLKKRQAVLSKLLTQLHSERPKAKVRRKKKIVLFDPFFDKGDCLTFQLKNKNFGGAIVLETIKEQEHPHTHLLAVTDINQPREPKIEDFKDSSVLVGLTQDVDTTQIVEQLELYWCSSTDDTFIDGKVVKKVCSIEIKKRYSYDDYRFKVSYPGNFELAVIPRVEHIFETGPSSKLKSKPLKPFIKDTISTKISQLFNR